MSFVLLLIAIQSHVVSPQAASVDALMSAIRRVESNDRTDVVGDNGRAIGPYQIHFGYWKDSGVKGRWQQCRDRAYSEKVMRAYWRRHCPRAFATGDSKTLARIHNGGPRGHLRAATHKYWTKVEASLRSAASPAKLKRTNPPKARGLRSRGKQS